MHAEAAWNTVSVADLSVGGLVPRPPSTRGLDHSWRNMFDAWHIAHNLYLRFDPTSEQRSHSNFRG